LNSFQRLRAGTSPNGGWSLAHRLAGRKNDGAGIEPAAGQSSD
jgi:hypothetical protein